MTRNNPLNTFVVMVIFYCAACILLLGLEVRGWATISPPTPRDRVLTRMSNSQITTSRTEKGICLFNSSRNNEDIGATNKSTEPSPSPSPSPGSATATSITSPESEGESSPLSLDASESSSKDAEPAEEKSTTRQQPPSPSATSSTANSNAPSSLSAQDMMVALGTSPRRIFLSGLSGAGIALAGNLFGVTSQLLTAFPEDQVAATGLDTYFPRGDYKRVRTADYEFVVPKQWVADTAVELAKAQRRSRALDYSMASSRGGGGGGGEVSSTLPDSAFGPPGNRLNSNDARSAADTNVSVIRTPTPPNFRLELIMGEATQGAQFLLDKFLAPVGSGRQATLLTVRPPLQQEDGTVYYRFGYRVDRGTRGVPLQAISIVAQPARRNLFVCFTVVAPEEDWVENNAGGSNTSLAKKLNKMADSFRLVV